MHHALREKSPATEHVIIHTGQHYDPLFSDVFFEQLALPTPDENLGIHGGTREEVIAKTAEAFTQVLEHQQPDLVLVYGDVNGAVGAARAASAAGIPLAHVEAGLRSFDESMPEEHNRKEIDGLADLLLCSEQSGVDHLQAEEARGEVHLVGNTMIDTLIRMKPAIDREPLAVQEDRFSVVTLHRPGNVDDKAVLESLVSFLTEISTSCSLVLPVHHRLKSRLLEFSLFDQIPQTIHLIDPLGYIPFLRLVSAANFIVTDSGGVQEEAAFLGKRCFTLRPNTERPATIESGSNTLINPQSEADRQTVLQYVESPSSLEVRVPKVWDGQAGTRIVEVITRFLTAA